ncbi:hypothetical protein MTO96_039138 [Rhipicephalus appendiculatus]
MALNHAIEGILHDATLDESITAFRYAKKERCRKSGVFRIFLPLRLNHMAEWRVVCFDNTTFRHLSIE